MLVASISEFRKDIKEYFDILSALRRLEKIADRAVSIANLLQFAQVGGDIVQS